MYRSFFVALATTILLSSCATHVELFDPELQFSQELDAQLTELVSAADTSAGISVAVYTPSGTYLRGFGIADATTGELVTPDTAFYIASSTKSFVSLTMQILEREGHFSLGDSIDQFAPTAGFDTKLPTDKITIQDLLTHTSGLENPAAGFLSAYAGITFSEQVQSLIPLTVENKAAPHGDFEYTNDGYNLLTALTDQALDAAWQDLVETNLIVPLGLERTTTRMSDATKNQWSIAKPHFLAPDGSMVVSPVVKNDRTMHSAGGMIMSGRDALVWLEFLIKDGVVSGRRITPKELLIQSRQPMALLQSSFGAYERDAYGLGWYIGRYGGDTLIHHFGGFPGYRAHISYMPERDIGVAVFVNEALAGSVLTDEIANEIYDHARDLPMTKARLQTVKARLETARAAQLADLEKRARRHWNLILPASEYVGSYHHPLLGEMRISLNSSRLSARLGELSSQLEPFARENTARAELIPLSGSVISFHQDNGAVTSLTWNGQSFHRR